MVAEVREGIVSPSEKVLELIGGREEAWRVAKWVVDRGILEGKVYLFEDELTHLIEELKTYPIYLKRSYKNFLFRKGRKREYKEFWVFYY